LGQGGAGTIDFDFSTAAQVAQAREAALADPEGDALAKALAEITGAPGEREAAE